jgi:malonyl-CoA O-methyltransferase
MNFDKYFSTYNKYAYIQKYVACDLNQLIPKIKIDTALELGCGTGIFTKQFLNKFNPQKMILNDYYDVRSFLTVPYYYFLPGNIETLKLPSVDIIISSSVFQWIKKLDILLLKLATKCQTLAFSMYIEGNLNEINQHFNLSLNYKTAAEIKNMLNPHFRLVKTKTTKYQHHFNQPIDALKHLKYTGVVNAKKKASLRKVRSFSAKTLTYKVGFCLALH